MDDVRKIMWLRSISGRELRWRRGMWRGRRRIGIEIESRGRRRAKKTGLNKIGDMMGRRHWRIKLLARRGGEPEGLLRE